MKLHRRVDWFVVALCAFVVSCGSGGGCSGCGGCALQPIPGGFPAGKRAANAGQLRITSSGFTKITADPATLIGPLVGGGGSGVISYPITTCGSTAVCCDANGNAIPNCGPLDIDLVKRNGDANRLDIVRVGTAAPNGELDVTVRARVKTEHTLIVTYSGLHCTVDFDTTAGGSPDLVVDTHIQLNQDATAGTTKLNAATMTITLEQGDYSIGAVNPFSADAGCYVAGFIPPDTIAGFLATPIQDQINGALCKPCPGGTVAECGSSFATACTGGVCQEGGACLQELGIDGRAVGNVLFGSLSPGTTGALDLYEVAGGYSLTAESNGLSIGLLGGMEPGGVARDRCGPAATEPAAVSVPRSTFFQGNTRPDNAQPFDVGIGIHKSQLARFAFAGYDGGLLCLTIGHNTVAELTTDTIGLLSRSLGHLVGGNSPMAIGLRPQSPPTMALGNNTFTTDGQGNRTLVDPLIDLHFTAMEIDFFASVDNQYIRVFTVVSDVHLPIGLDIGMGQLTPVLGNVADAFTNVTVKNSDAVTESPADLAALFPTLLNLVLPTLSGGLSPIALPNLGGLALSVTGITAVDDRDADGKGDFLAIFANLVPATTPRTTLHTTLDVTSIDEPDDVVARTPAKWPSAHPPAVTLALGAQGYDARDLEFSLRLDDGTWTPWSRNAKPVLSPRTFWLPGVHKVEARARDVRHPDAVDVVPARIDLPLGTSVRLGHDRAAKLETGEAADQPHAIAQTNVEDFHGQPGGAGGCSCDARGRATDGLPLVLALGLLLLPFRRVRRALRRTSATVWLVAIACLPGCSCGKPCGDVDCVAGSLNGAVGRWTSIAGDDQRVMIATYDQVFGDLVVADATDPAKLAFTSIDGVPTDVTPTHDPSTWRGGIEDLGTDVGAWTSIALANHGARVAYQDRDAGALKYAFETGDGWKNYVVDAGHGEAVGAYASMAIDADKHPAIAYIATGNDDGMGHKITELRLARSTKADPASSGDWTHVAIASAAGTCAGLCGNQSCIAGAAATDPQVCASPTTNCTATCASGDICHAGACVTPIADPKLDDLPPGTGLYVSLVVLADGRLAAAYYDTTRRALVLGVEATRGASDFAETILDGNVAGADRGMWSSAVVGGDGTVHIAYQDALGDQLMYTTWNGAPGTPELVDDGQRAGDRTHPVGAAASIYLVNGSPAIAYQDGLTADVYVATRGASWTTSGLAMGPLLDGFSIAVTTAHGGTPVLAWDSLDPSKTPPNGVVVKKN